MARVYQPQADEYNNRDGVLPDGRVRRGDALISADDANRTRMDRDRNQALSRDTGANPDNQLGASSRGNPVARLPDVSPPSGSVPDMTRPISFSNGGGQDPASQARARDAFAAFRQSAADNRGPIDVRSYTGSRYDPNFAANNPSLQVAPQESDAVKIARIATEGRNPQLPAAPAPAPADGVRSLDTFTPAQQQVMQQPVGAGASRAFGSGAAPAQTSNAAPVAPVNNERLAAATSTPTQSPVPTDRAASIAASKADGTFAAKRQQFNAANIGRRQMGEDGAIVTVPSMPNFTPSEVSAGNAVPTGNAFELTYQKPDGTFHGETRDGRSQVFRTQEEATAFSRGPAPTGNIPNPNQGLIAGITPGFAGPRYTTSSQPNPSRTPIMAYNAPGNPIIPQSEMPAPFVRPAVTPVPTVQAGKRVAASGSGQAPAGRGSDIPKLPFVQAAPIQRVPITQQRAPVATNLANSPISAAPAVQVMPYNAAGKPIMPQPAPTPVNSVSTAPVRPAALRKPLRPTSLTQIENSPLRTAEPVDFPSLLSPGMRRPTARLA